MNLRIEAAGSCTLMPRTFCRIYEPVRLKIGTLSVTWKLQVVRHFATSSNFYALCGRTRCFPMPRQWTSAKTHGARWALFWPWLGRRCPWSSRCEGGSDRASTNQLSSHVAIPAAAAERRQQQTRRPPRQPSRSPTVSDHHAQGVVSPTSSWRSNKSRASPRICRRWWYQNICASY